MFKKSATGALTLIICSISVSATAEQRRQVRDDTKCPKPVYSSQDVTRRARITEGPDLGIAKEADPNFQGNVVLHAVLCRTGRVTDIRITEGSSPTVNDFVSAAVSMIQFVPAELNWHSVSQKIRFEFEFKNHEIRQIAPQESTRRLVESLTVLGNRRFTAKQVMSWIETRPGEPYDPDQVKSDLNAILATGNFDKMYTRVLVDDAVRGGVAVIFEVAELPLISEIKFVGLTLDHAWVVEAWRKENIDLRAGSVFKIEEAKKALRVIERLLVASGQSNLKAELEIERRTRETTNLVIAITAR